MILKLKTFWKEYKAGDIIELPTNDGRRLLELAMAEAATIAEVVASREEEARLAYTGDIKLRPSEQETQETQETQEVAPRPKAKKKKKKAKKKTVIPAGERSS